MPGLRSFGDSQNSEGDLVHDRTAPGLRRPVHTPYGVQWKISAGRMLKNWKPSLTELKVDLR